MYDLAAPRVLVILAFSAALLMVIRLIKPRIEPFERRTAVAVGPHPPPRNHLSRLV